MSNNAATGPAALLAETADRLRAAGDWPRLFEVRLLEARHALGLPLILTGPSTDLPPDRQTAYEERVVAACKEAGVGLLAAGDPAGAFRYLSMVGETAPLRDYLDGWRPADDADPEQVDLHVDLAVGHGVHPSRGLGWILDRYGTCQGVSTAEQLLGGPGQRNPAVRPADREACVRVLVRHLHRELIDRLRHDVAARDPARPDAAKLPGSVPLLLAGRPWLFEDDATHVDPSHLAGAVRLARDLPKGDDLFLSLQLCEYGVRLGERFRYDEPPPFEDLYADTLLYLKAVAGMDVAKGLDHFRRKAEQFSVAEAGTPPAETYVQLLLSCRREDEAFRMVEQRLNEPGVRLALLPGVNELCQKHGRFDLMRRLAERRGDAVGELAGRLQGASG